MILLRNLAGQYRVVEHQLDIGLQAIAASELSDTSQQERRAIFTDHALLFGLFSTNLLAIIAVAVTAPSRQVMEIIFARKTATSSL